MIYILDTHPVIWFLEKSPRLSASAKSILDDANADLVLPTIVLLEIQSLYSKNCIQISPEDIRPDLISLTNCLIYPLMNKLFLCAQVHSIFMIQLLWALPWSIEIFIRNQFHLLLKMAKLQNQALAKLSGNFEAIGR